EEPSDIGSPGVIVYGYDGLSMHLVDPPSPDYVPRPEHPPSSDYVPGPELPPLPVYVHEPEYLKYLVPSEDEAPMEDQPLLDDALPTTLSLGYVVDFDPEEDPEEDHVDYPADGGDGDDESSDNDDDEVDDEDEKASKDEDDNKEEEEHLAMADSFVVSVVDLVLSTGDSKAFETDESTPKPPAPRSPQIVVPLSQTRLHKARKMVRPQKPIPFPSKAEGLNRRVTKLATTVRQDTSEFNVRFKGAQDDRAFLRARVNTLFRDRPYHRCTTMLLDKEATYAHKAWTGSEDWSAAIEALVRTLEAHVATLMAQTSSLQAPLTTTLGRIQTLKARDPEPQGESAKAVSSLSDDRGNGGDDIGSGGEGIWDSREDNGLSRDGGGVGKARSLATSALDGNGIVAGATRQPILDVAIMDATAGRPIDRPYHRCTTMLLDKEATYARKAWTGSEDWSAAIEALFRTLEAHVATLMAQTSSLQAPLTTTLGRIQTLKARDPEPQGESAKAGSSC
nr:hypothetical protein [Tanacetum cinerariifolium]